MFPLICKRKEINRKDSTGAYGPHEAILSAARTNHISGFPGFCLLGHACLVKFSKTVGFVLGYLSWISMRDS